MTIGRMFSMIRISFMKNGFQRAEYLKKKHVFASMGENCFWQPRNIPPEAKLIKLHDNVVIASEVLSKRDAEQLDMRSKADRFDNAWEEFYKRYGN